MAITYTVNVRRLAREETTQAKVRFITTRRCLRSNRELPAKGHKSPGVAYSLTPSAALTLRQMQLGTRWGARPY